MAGLTFVNQVGAVEGMNQAAPGTLIPDTFVRWSQDVLFDRAGLMRRRGPFEKFRMYNSDDTENTTAFIESNGIREYILGVFSTYDPVGTPRIAMIINSYNGTITKTIIRVFDNHFRFLGQETLFGSVPTNFIENLSIVSAKPALGGGLWISFSGVPSDPTQHYQLFWRGGYASSDSKTGTFTLSTDAETIAAGFEDEHKVLNTTITLNNRTNVSVGQFVFATYSGVDYYIGTVKEVPSGTSTIILEKRPFIWDPIVDNNHYVSLLISDANWSANVATITTSTVIPFEIGDVVTISGVPSPYGGSGTPPYTGYNGTFTIKTIPTSTTFTYDLNTSNPGHYTPSTPYSATVKMANDLEDLSLSNIPLKFFSVRPYMHVHGRGLLSTTSAGGVALKSGAEGTSGEGHWKAAGVVNWNIYRASDNAYIGKVKKVTTNIDAETYADTGILLQGEEYIMMPTSGYNMGATDPSMIVSNRTANEFAGLYTAVYAGYQWYGNVANDDQNINRVVFSAAHDREAVDLSSDAADSIIFPGKSQFRGIGASSTGLLVFLEDRVYILRGNDRTNFSVEQLVPEGCLCASSIVEYGGGVFWAGKSGIMYYDGASVRNLTKDNLGLYYTDSLDTFNPEYDRVFGFIHKNNLIMTYTTWVSPFDPVRYEPIYAADWQTTEGIADRSWDEFDPDFEYDDFFTQNNTPIFWDRQILNNPEESATAGIGIVWKGASSIADSGTWKSGSNVQKWGPLRKQTGITFCLYLPTNALSTLSNMDFRGMTSIETVDGLKTIVGVNSVEDSVYFNVTNKQLTSNVATLTIDTHLLSAGNTITVTGIDSVFNGTYTISSVTSTTISYARTNSNVASTAISSGVVTKAFSADLRARLIDIHPVFDTNTNGEDDLLVEKINMSYTDLVKGPDFYLQTKHFTVGDPVLRKWFQRVMLSMLLYDGAIRMDLVDDDDNDEVDINKKKHKYWEVFTEKGYNWNYLGKGEGSDFGIQFPKITSPNKSNWANVEAALYLWDELFTADFNRYAKRLSWRKPSVGLRLYQLNKYKKPFNGVVTRPNRVEIQGFSIGFKALRQGRV